MKTDSTILASSLMDFSEKTMNKKYLLALKRYIRYTGYKVSKHWPTVFYDKLFTKAYQPFALRYNVLILASIFAAFKFTADRSAAKASEEP
mmetsp:Transcript_2640/g.4126  ORF Transcript_2640/g.4126 Transcript_2640/m.4126 type:complete len:91 (+) Transcript_2640:26-298(+)